MDDSVAHIRIRGARTHNLHNLNLDLPQERLTVITGVSGSGKSSLAFDTIYAEGRRRYLETLHADARALFDQLQRPDVDLMEGLPPTLCVSQNVTQARPRSTLATVTEIHDHLRLLWARLGTPHCPNCGTAIHKHTVSEIVRATLAQEEERKLYVLAPLVRAMPGEHKDAFQKIRQSGFLRARIDGVLTEVQGTPKMSAKKPHTIELVVDRLVLRPTIAERLRESVETAVKLGEGRVTITDADTGEWRDAAYTTRYECVRCGTVVPDPEPRRFHFNNPYGACPRCTGLGLVVEAASTVDAAPLEELQTLEQPFDADEEDESLLAQARLGVCPDCQGARLNPASRAVRFAQQGIHEVTALAVDAAAVRFEVLAETKEADPTREAVRSVLVAEILHRLRFLQQVGLGYLTLDRAAPTLSGGEAQRARLATHLGGGLLGVCYVLDEPTMGLHPRDTGRLIEALRALQQRGNTVLVVEHDEAVMRAADFLVDIGPGAGPDGGRLLASGTVAEVLANPASVTAPYLLGHGQRALKAEPLSKEQAWLTVRGARQHNLKNLDVAFPLGRWTCLTGVSGSGKSSLARDILCHAVRHHLGLSAPTPGEHDRIDGLDSIDKVIEVDQKPLHKSSRSSPATYIGLFEEVRAVFATTRMAKVRGYKANRFSFNVKGGRCEQCQGQGSLRVALRFLPDLTVACPACQRRRFNRATLEVLYRGKSIADVLDMPVAAAYDFFANLPALKKGLQALMDVGLGYLALGQPATTLSGGEAQRVKLSSELARSSTGQTLYLLDEPTTGLHFADVANLMRVLRRLVDAGNTLVVIEHHLDLIASADWVIDLGPEGGASGGYLLAAGTPAQIAGCGASITGRYLAPG